MNQVIEDNTAALMQRFLQEDPKGLHAMLVQLAMKNDMQKSETMSTGCTGKLHLNMADQFRSIRKERHF